MVVAFSCGEVEGLGNGMIAGWFDDAMPPPFVDLFGLVQCWAVLGGSCNARKATVADLFVIKIQPTP